MEEHEIYKKNRPATLEDVIGCPDVTEALESYFDRGTLPHCVLFAGPSGTGKTTLMRICAAMLKCKSLDFREYNCATDTGIDVVRRIESGLRLAPRSSPCVIYAMDEIHKLSTEAQNGLLKMTEDTPKHVYFLLATSEPEKIIPALRSRPTPFVLHSLSEDELEVILLSAMKKEKIKLSETITSQLIVSAGGNARVLLVLLDKLRQLEPKRQEAAIQLELQKQNAAGELAEALMKNKPWSVVQSMLRNLKDAPENTRYAVLAWAKGYLLNPRSKGDEMYRACLVIDRFENHFYDSKLAGLAKACFEVAHAQARK